MSYAIEFVSPESVLFSGEATQVLARTRGGGDIAFLTGHEPFIGSLEPSEVKVTGTSGQIDRFAVRGGFVSVTGDTVTVLSDFAVPAADIDVAAAREAQATAAAAVAADEGDSFAKDDLRWAEVLLRVAGATD